jgi:hypothetical protein
VSEPVVEIAKDSAPSVPHGQFDAASGESPEEEVALEVAAAPVMEATPVEESAALPEGEERSGIDEQPEADEPDERVAALDEQTAVMIFDGDALTETEKVLDTTVAKETTDESGESETVSNTLDSEAVQELPTATMPLVEVQEQEEQGQEQEKEQTERSSAEQAEQSVAYNAEILPTAEPVAVPLQVASTAYPTEAPASEQIRDYILGAEVILALSAFGAGLAWFYLRRRGG